MLTFASSEILAYEWPVELIRALTLPQWDVFDSKEAFDAIGSLAGSGCITLTFLTEEYFDLGLMWVERARQVGASRVLVAAADVGTCDRLAERSIPYVALTLPPIPPSAVDFRNRGGFGPKALGLILHRTRLIRLLVSAGIDVLACDVDALLLSDPNTWTRDTEDVTFQRVAYFPKSIAREWGFAACAGFVFYRGRPNVANLLGEVVRLQCSVSSDQLALNLALHEAAAKWERVPGNLPSDAAVREHFLEQAALPVIGTAAKHSLSLRALPATSAWRHHFVHFDRENAVVVHPNSPKRLADKLKVIDGMSEMIATFRGVGSHGLAQIGL